MMDHYDNDDGFALVSVLFLSLVVASFLISLQMIAREFALQGHDSRDEAALRLALQAGMLRLIECYRHPDDDLRSSLLSDGREVVWQLGNWRLALSAEAESGKWDVNAGDTSQIRRVLVLVGFDSTASASIMQRVEQARAQQKPLQNVLDVLEPAQRLSQLADVMERHFTVLTDQFGINPSTAPMAIIQAILGTSSHEQPLDELRHRALASSSTPFVNEKPVYTFRVQTAGPQNRRQGALKAIVLFRGQEGPMFLNWQRTGISSANLAGAATSQP